MTNSIQSFALSENQIIRKNGEFYFSTRTISQLLGTPINNVQQNIYRHKEEFGELLIDSQSTNSVGRPSMLLDEEQFYIYCMISKSQKARMLHREFAKMIKGIRSKEFIHITEYQTVLKQLKEATNQLLGKNARSAFLSAIPARKLNRYKKFREMKLSRKEACKALELPYKTMQKADKILGYYKEMDENTRKALLPYEFVPNSGRKRRYEIEPNLFEVQ